MFLPSILIVISCNKDIPNTAKIDGKTGEITERSINVKSGNSQDFSYKKYKGAWFDIEYPSTFKVGNSLKSATNVDGFDSATFTSPDGKVQFYVFSPQWSGEAIDILLKPSEIQLESSSKIQNGLQIKRWTVKARNGSYFRSYEATSETESNINKVFGIKYGSKEDLDMYKESYLHFKNSLQQYAD